MEKYKFIALIPAYQPDDKLIELVKKLAKEKVEIIVVDDGSKSKCKNIFKEIESISHVIHHKTNKGKGRALKTGLEFIKKEYENNNYIVITLDCDGQHTIEDAKKLFEYNVKHPNTLVLGSRKFDKDVPLRSMLGNTITRYIYSMVTGTKIYDTQTGLRSFSNRLIEQMILITGERFEYEINVLLQMAKEKIPIKEIIIQTIYLDDNASSHFNTIKDSIKIYKEILKFSLSSILSFILDLTLYSILLIVFRSFRYCLQTANILARIFSATFNFCINRNYVFKRKRNLKKEIIGYISLATLILILNTIILSFLVNNLLLNKILAKIIVEVTLFIISYIIQSTIIFKKK